MNDALFAACKHALHVVKRDGTVLRAGRATLYVLSHIGWGWFARLLMWPPFVWFVELGYWIVARNRMLFSKVIFRK
jgi:predicted DCC family thiol-disulfide oxidoreductase YuxK